MQIQATVITAASSMNGAGFSKLIGTARSSLGSMSNSFKVLDVMVCSSWLKFFMWVLVARKLAK